MERKPSESQTQRAFEEFGMKPSRRGALTMLAGFGCAASFAPLTAMAADDGLVLGPPSPFDFDMLVARAREAAATPYRPARIAGAAQMALIDYDAHWRIVFREEASLTPAGEDAPVQFFHPGKFFPEPVAMHVVQDGAAREATFSQDYFEMPEDSPARGLPDGVGFAGFRIMRPGMEPDWISFLGASYFRTDGPDAQYGLSARGIAIDTGLATAEEFPRFTAFWLAPPEKTGDDMTVWALLDGPSLAGAYQFDVRHGEEGEGHVTRVSSRLFMRSAVERLGVAPLTSMYWYSERDRMIADEWRPEIHDSDGLALATGGGERIWRALDNPLRVTTSSYFDENPQGFGLIQRDRSFVHYEDDGVFYNRRPSAWIEPVGDWGRGAVQLVQIPTADETFDNIVAYWTPETQPAAGAELSYDYVIHWTRRDPEPGTVASVVATRQGQGGVPGQPIPDGIDKMVVDFAGGPLEGLDADSGVEPVVEARRGRILEPIAARPVAGGEGGGRWRLSFDFETYGDEPAELRAYLKRGDQALTETWLAQASTDRGALRL